MPIKNEKAESSKNFNRCRCRESGLIGRWYELLRWLGLFGQEKNRQATVQFFASAALQKKMPGNARTLSDALIGRREERCYFLFASTTRSIPILETLTDTTIPNTKIAIGTKSSIGIAYSSILLHHPKKAQKASAHPLLLEHKSIGISIDAQHLLSSHNFGTAVMYQSEHGVAAMIYFLIESIGI